MKIVRREHGTRGAFYIEKDGEWIAEMTYRREGARKIVIDHTEIEDSLRGRGIGKKMVEAAVTFARRDNLLIKPVCPFVKKVLESSEEYDDVLTR